MKRWLNPEREALIIELYEKYEKAEPVAEIISKSTETVYRVLRKHNIKRTHRHDNEEQNKTSPNCASRKLCPGLIVMLHTCMKWSPKEISDFTGGKYKKGSVQSILSKRGLVNAKSRSKKSDFELDQIEYEYVTLGTSSYKLSKKYGAHPATINKWMRERGHHLGKGAHQEGRVGKSRSAGDFVYSDKMKELNQQAHEEATLRFAKKLQERFCGRFVVAGEYRPDGKLLATVRCTECGHVFTHSIDMRKNWYCPECKKADGARSILIDTLKKLVRNKTKTCESVDKAIGDYRSAARSLQTFLIDKKCVVCGAMFHSDNPRQVCCSHECSKKNAKKRGRGDFHRHRARRYHVAFDRTISLHALYERDDGICQICGEPCDWNDDSYGACGPTYPSIDHIRPFAQGGGHTWDNVQLAHFMCNSVKGSTYGEVTPNAKLAC